MQNRPSPTPPPARPARGCSLAFQLSSIGYFAVALALMASPSAASNRKLALPAHWGEPRSAPHYLATRGASEQAHQRQHSTNFWPGRFQPIFAQIFGPPLGTMKLTSICSVTPTAFPRTRTHLQGFVASWVLWPGLWRRGG